MTESSDSKEQVPVIKVRKKPVEKTIKVISLFSGCGGMDLGFKGGFEFLGKKYAKNPFEIVWANDFNEAACRSYARNIGK
ncbi:DNA cytosine methyltransferase, partial [Rhodoferax sp. 4810]|nr:DNA cytosine methyltransferase [Rhodoferax jenense]